MVKMAREKKKKSTFQKITMFVVWVMLIFTVGAVISGSVGALIGYYSLKKRGWDVKIPTSLFSRWLQALFT